MEWKGEKRSKRDLDFASKRDQRVIGENGVPNM